MTSDDRQRLCGSLQKLIMSPSNSALWCQYIYSNTNLHAPALFLPFLYVLLCGISLCLGKHGMPVIKIREHSSRDPAFPLESRRGLESPQPMQKPSGYGRYVERFLLPMPLIHSGRGPLPYVWNGSLHLMTFWFFTNAVAALHAYGMITLGYGHQTSFTAWQCDGYTRYIEKYTCLVFVTPAWTKLLLHIFSWDLFLLTVLNISHIYLIYMLRVLKK